MESADAKKLKKVFSTNLCRLMELHDKRISDISMELGIAYTTVSSWVHGDKYPRMDKVQALADYFRVLKSDLTEEKQEHHSANIAQPGDFIIHRDGTVAKYNALNEENKKKLDDYFRLLLLEQENKGKN